MYVMAIIYCVGDVSPLKFFAIGGKFSTGAILVITLACYQVRFLGLQAPATGRRIEHFASCGLSKNVKVLVWRLSKLQTIAESWNQRPPSMRF